MGRSLTVTQQMVSRSLVFKRFKTGLLRDQSSEAVEFELVFLCSAFRQPGNLQALHWFHEISGGLNLLDQPSRRLKSIFRASQEFLQGSPKHETGKA